MSAAGSSRGGRGGSRRGRSRGLADVMHLMESDAEASAPDTDTESIVGVDSQSVRARASNGSSGTEVSETSSVASGMSRVSIEVKPRVEVEASARPAGLGEKGTVGQPQPVVTNYFKMNKTADFTLYGYRVDFEPEEDDTKNKRALMRIHEDVLGHFKFDGHTLYSGKVFPPELLSLRSVNQLTQQEYQIRLRKVTEVDPGSKLYLQFYNIALRSIMEKIGLEQVGRHFYDRRQGKEIKMPNYKLVLWPGFITAVREHEGGMLLCAEVTHKVLRGETAFDVMLSIANEAERLGRNVNEEMKKGLLDSIVITHYNRKTYRIDDINFDISPASEFTREDGTVMTYVQYYRERWNIIIEDSDLMQPMLVSSPRRKDINKGVQNDIYLIPSLCNMTGLTDQMRKNFTLMRDLSVHLHMSPQERKKKLDEFISEFAKPEIKAEFDRWHFEFSTDFVKADARIFPREKVQMIDSRGNPEYFEPDRSSDWTIHFKNAGLLSPVTIKKWIIYAPEDVRAAVASLLRTLKDVGRKLGVMFENEIDTVFYNGRQKFDRSGFLAGIKGRTDIEFVFFILPNNALPRYAAVKRACTLELKSVSQCFLAKHLGPNAKNLNSICQKMLIQVNAKMRGEPWAVKIPLPKLMVLGFDVYHCPDRKGESVGALVGTVNKNCTQYYSTVSFHKDKAELSLHMNSDITKCLNAYYEINKELPTRVVMFRDGVGEGQIEYVIENEVRQVEDGINRFCNSHGCTTPIKLAFIIVTKKINTRYLVQERQKWLSPIPGTVLDTVVTLPERYDFFLVSQTVRQGTVSPTNYHIVTDTSGLNADKLQQLTYKLCHLYFNWSGTVAVPAPCQYAHKLAYITGMALADEAPIKLSHNLWYL